MQLSEVKSSQVFPKDRYCFRLVTNLMLEQIYTIQVQRLACEPPYLHSLKPLTQCTSYKNETFVGETNEF